MFQISGDVGTQDKMGWGELKPQNDGRWQGGGGEDTEESKHFCKQPEAGVPGGKLNALSKGL